MCTNYYEDRMNSFQIFIKYVDVVFGQIKDFFFVTKFQVEGLPHDHGLLWVENVAQFAILTNENIECFVDTYLTTNQTI